jgi:hypothetical protein
MIAIFVVLKNANAEVLPIIAMVEAAAANVASLRIFMEEKGKK